MFLTPRIISIVLGLPVAGNAQTTDWQDVFEKEVRIRITLELPLRRHKDLFVLSPFPPETRRSILKMRARIGGSTP